MLKVNDAAGNPVEIAAVITWRVVDTAKAIFDVEDYQAFVRIQSETGVRHVASRYPYDAYEEGVHSLQGNTEEVAETLQVELQTRLAGAGVAVMDTRLRRLAYAPEIAGEMLRRQQANAVVAARHRIVEGAVGMVEMALRRLSEDGIVVLDEERKAALVANLMVVLVSDRGAQPVVSGELRRVAECLRWGRQSLRGRRCRAGGGAGGCWPFSRCRSWSSPVAVRGPTRRRPTPPRWPGSAAGTARRSSPSRRGASPTVTCTSSSTGGAPGTGTQSTTIPARGRCWPGTPRRSTTRVSRYTAGWMAPMAAALARLDPGAVVLAFSWLDQSATSDTPFAARISESRTVPNGERLGVALNQAIDPGFAARGGMVHMLGHSHGAKVATIGALSLPTAPAQLTLLDSPDEIVTAVVFASNDLVPYLRQLQIGRAPGRTFVDNYFSEFGRAYGNEPGLEDIVDVSLPPDQFERWDLQDRHDYPPRWYTAAAEQPAAASGRRGRPCSGPSTRASGRTTCSSSRATPPSSWSWRRANGRRRPAPGRSSTTGGARSSPPRWCWSCSSSCLVVVRIRRRRRPNAWRRRVPVDHRRRS